MCAVTTHLSYRTFLLVGTKGKIPTDYFFVNCTYWVVLKTNSATEFSCTVFIESVYPTGSLDPKQLVPAVWLDRRLGEKSVAYHCGPKQSDFNSCEHVAVLQLVQLRLS